MMKILDSIITISALTFLLSLFAMGAYLYREKIYTAWQLRTTFLWPKIIFEYRDHTKKYYGKKGVWFYIGELSFFISIISFIASFVPQLLLLPTPIVIVVLIATATIIPALGYAIYEMSKEKYF